MAANLTGGGKRMAAEYREAHPQVAMRMEHQGGSHSDSGARLRLSFRSETGPGIIHEPHDVNLTSLMSAGFTAPAPDDLVAIIEGDDRPERAPVSARFTPPSSPGSVSSTCTTLKYKIRVALILYPPCDLGVTFPSAQRRQKCRYCWTENRMTECQLSLQDAKNQLSAAGRQTAQEVIVRSFML